MTEYKYTLYDGKSDTVKADEYKAEGTACVFYEGRTVVRTVPLYMLEKVEKMAAQAEKVKR